MAARPRIRPRVPDNVLGRLIDYCDALHGRSSSPRRSASASSSMPRDWIWRRSKIRCSPTSWNAPACKAPTGWECFRESGAWVSRRSRCISLAAGVFYFSPGCWCCSSSVRSRLSGRKPFRISGLHLGPQPYSDRRQLDYLRVLGASKESAKEVKIFGLGPYITERYREIADRVFEQNRSLVTRRMWAGAASCDHRVHRILRRLRAGGLLARFRARSLLATSHFLQAQSREPAPTSRRCSPLSPASPIRRFSLPTCWSSSRRSRSIRSPDRPLPVPRPIRDGFEFRKVCFQYPGIAPDDLARSRFPAGTGRARRADRSRTAQGKTTFVKLAGAPLRSHRRPNSAGRQ